MHIMHISHVYIYIYLYLQLYIYIYVRILYNWYIYIPPYNLCFVGFKIYLASQHPTATHRSLSQDDTANRSSHKAWVCWTMGEGVCVFVLGSWVFLNLPKSDPLSPPPQIYIVVVWFHISSWGRNTTKRHFQ